MLEVLMEFGWFIAEGAHLPSPISSCDGRPFRSSVCGSMGMCFSSSKETCTLRRSRLSPQLMEALQVLEFAHRRERLNLTAGLVTTLDELEEDTARVHE